MGSVGGILFRVTGSERGHVDIGIFIVQFATFLHVSFWYLMRRGMVERIVRESHNGIGGGDDTCGRKYLSQLGQDQLMWALMI